MKMSEEEGRSFQDSYYSLLDWLASVPFPAWIEIWNLLLQEKEKKKQNIRNRLASPVRGTTQLCDIFLEAVELYYIQMPVELCFIIWFGGC
jgi:hypothetical protein